MIKQTYMYIQQDEQINLKGNKNVDWHYRLYKSKPCLKPAFMIL